MSRLVAVLGYSDVGGGDALHPVCAARVTRAEEEAGSEDVILFSGWARRGRATSEAELMAAAWSSTTRRHLVDRGARTTLGNAIAVGRVSRAAVAEPKSPCEPATPVGEPAKCAMRPSLAVTRRTR